MQKSTSLPKLPSQASYSRQNSVKILDSRLNFPKPGDSSIFKNAGRKHFQNHSDRMLKIILPQKYAAQKPIPILRENSLPPPHLIRHDSERLIQQRHHIKQDTSVLSVRQTSLRDKIEDQLDRMRRSMDKHKSKNSPQITISQKVQTQPKSVPLRHVKQNTMRISNLFSLTPSVSVKIQNQHQSRPRLLYNPQNKQKYDALAMGRWKNPTNLSTGLSII